MTPKILVLSVLVALAHCQSENHTYEMRRSCKFDAVRVCDHFVDKTEMIKIVFDDLHSTRCIFLSAAHGFGSSVNLGMLDMFTNQEFDFNRHPIPPKESYAYSVFKDNLKISQYEDVIGWHLGQYTVVPLRLREYQQPEITLKHIAWSINMMVGWSNRRWRWVGFNTKNFTNDSETSQRDFSFLQKIQRTKLRYHELTSAVEKYVELLYRYFGKKIIIMVDDYDRVFRRSVQHTLKNIDLYYWYLNQALLPLIKDTERVYKVIITGTTTLPLYYGNSSLAEFVEKYTFLHDHAFSPFFGFDDQEVEGLFNKYGLPLEDKAELEALANGYKTLSQHSTRYNSEVTMAYFRHRQNLIDDIIFNATAAQKKSEDFEHYFPTPFLMVPPFRYKIIELMHKLDVEFNLVEYNSSSFDKFVDFTLYDYINKDTFSLDLLFTYIFEQGFLRLTNVPNKYHIPNKVALNETWTAMKIYYQDIGEQSLNEIATDFKKILLSENSTQIDTFKDHLQLKLTNYFKQLTEDEHFQELNVPEYQFHSIINAAIVSSADLNLNEDELEVFGKSHILFSTPASTTKGVIEIKYGESAEQALELALSTFISDTEVTELKYIGINVDQQRNTTILVQLKPIQEHEQNPYGRK